MALSSAPNNDILKSNRITSYTQGVSSDFYNYDQSKNLAPIKILKMTAKQIKPSYRANISDKTESKMKKSSSLHNIEKLNEDQQFTNSTQNINKKYTAYDKQQINLNSELLSRIEREKKQYEAKISELIQNLEMRKKDKEMLSYEKKNLIEKVKLMQKDFKQITGENTYLKYKLKEYGIEIDYEGENQDEKQDILNASGDTVIDGCSVTFATVGDSSSLCDQLSDDSPNNVSMNDEYIPQNFIKPNSDRDILDSLSVSTLQDRIQKMEEDSYCTNEELQATMQELVDLQKSLDQLNEENRCLGDDRVILLESLCEQTQKLQKCQLQIDHLKYLLLNTGSKDILKLESKLQELYSISEEENKSLHIQNEECKQTIMSCQNEYRELSGTIEYLKEELDRQIHNFNVLEDKHKEEMWQREQVEALLKNHNELFSNLHGWVDCSSGVLALIQQAKNFRQTEVSLRAELVEKNLKIKQLEESIKELHSNHRKEHKHQNMEQLQLRLKENEKELRLLNQNLDVLSQKYAEDMTAWRDYECDLLIAITAANSLKEEKEKELQDIELKLEASELLKRQLQEKLEGKSKDRVIGLVERSNRPGLVIPKTQTSTTSSTNSSVKNLIQSIEDQVKGVRSSTKEQVIVPKTTLNNNTVPRSSTLSKPENNIIGRAVTCRLKEESPVIRRSSELSQSKLAAETISEKRQNNNQLSESFVDKPPQITAVVNQASSILQSVSRRNSVTSTIPSDHHIVYPSSSTKSPSPPPTSSDCLSQLVKKTNKGSKRNALLYWCQNKTIGYSKIDITNFSSSWNDGLALCALFHSYDKDILDFKKLADATSTNPDKNQKRINFQSAFNAAEKMGIKSQLSIESMIIERPDWNNVMNYVTEIYQRFEIDN